MLPIRWRARTIIWASLDPALRLESNPLHGGQVDAEHRAYSPGPWVCQPYGIAGKGGLPRVLVV